MNTTDTITIKQRAVNTLERIKALPVAQIDLRQPMLVAFAAETVQYFKQTRGFDGDCYPMHEAWWHSYRAVMTEAGFVFLGAGFFSAAFSHPLVPERAFKVGFKKEDSGAAYTAFCRANQHRPGIPKVYAVERHQSCYTVVLDLLTEFDFCGASKEASDGFNMARDIIEYGRGQSYAALRTAAGNTLCDTAFAIHEFFTGIASFDLHPGNVMLDKRGELVITDPVSYSHGELNAVDFDGLVHEVQSLKDQRVARRALARWKRHHMSTEANKDRKDRNKRNRKQSRARKLHRDAEQRLKDNPMLTGDVLPAHLRIAWYPKESARHWMEDNNFFRRRKPTPLVPDSVGSRLCGYRTAGPSGVLGGGATTGEQHQGSPGEASRERLA